jgi:hypothetical protein
MADGDDENDELNKSSVNFEGDRSRALDTHAGQVIAGVAGVDFSRHVWTRDSDNDFEMNAFDESSMRSWVWKKLIPDVINLHQSEKNADGTSQLRPLKLGVDILTVIKAFKTAERVVSKKALSPLVLSCALEAVNEICTMQMMKNLVSEDKKEQLSCFLRRHAHYAPTFCVYVGYSLMGKQMIQNGSSNTIRKMNQVLLMKNSASSRLRDVLLASGCGKIKSQFEEALHLNDYHVEDWKEMWYKAWSESLKRPEPVIEDSATMHRIPVSARPEFHTVYEDLSPSISVKRKAASFPWD